MKYEQSLWHYHLSVVLAFDIFLFRPKLGLPHESILSYFLWVWWRTNLLVNCRCLFEWNNVISFQNHQTSKAFFFNRNSSNVVRQPISLNLFLKSLCWYLVVIFRRYFERKTIFPNRVQKQVFTIKLYDKMKLLFIQKRILSVLPCSFFSVVRI